MDRWHLTYEDIAVCRLVIQVASQTSAKVCPSCLDSIADARLQWLNLNLTELMTRHDSVYLPVLTTDVKNAMGTSFGVSQFIIADQE